jgi:hypothetical protein
MRAKSAALMTALAAILAVSLAGCGKAGRPLQPEDSIFPRLYPNPADTPANVKVKNGKVAPPEWDQKDLQDRFTAKGSYIDPSTKVISNSQLSGGSTLPNTTTSTGGSDVFSQGMGSTSTLPPVQSTSPTDIEDQQ